MHGAIACGHPVTAAAAQQILEEGGNAFDAVIAAALAASVAEPVLCSLAGGGFLLAHPRASDPVVYDFFAQTPRARQSDAEFYPIHAQFGTTTQEFHIGMGAVATPGFVAGLTEIHADLATMPLPEIAAPAVRAAADGIAVTPLQADIFEIVAPIYQSEAARANYPNVRAGERFVQMDLARSLTMIANEGADAFYRGEIGARLAKVSADAGGHITADDLNGYRVNKVEPLELSYRDRRILTNPPPSAGGVLIGFGLELLHAVDRVPSGDKIERLQLLDRVLTTTAKVREQVVADDGSGLAELADRYHREIAPSPASHRGTTHISVIDREGNAASLTASNGEGAGHLIPGTGIMLNNMLGEEDINPHGFNQWPLDTRMSSMMAPSIVESQNGDRHVLGSGGSNRIRSAILQVISNLVDLRDPPPAAVARSRMHVEADTTSLEGVLPEGLLNEFRTLYPAAEIWPEQSLFFGGVHVAALADGELAAAGDPRRGGVSVVV